jgi:hypothetical protein
VESEVEPIGMRDIDAIVALDRQASGTDRSKLLRYVLAEGRCVARVVRSSTGLAGCILDRPGAVARQIGPCLGSEPAGLALIDDALARYAGQNIYIDIPIRQQAACELAESCGLIVQRPLFRMTRGPLVTERPEMLWASFGPEKG